MEIEERDVRVDEATVEETEAEALDNYNEPYISNLRNFDSVKAKLKKIKDLTLIEKMGDFINAKRTREELRELLALVDEESNSSRDSIYNKHLYAAFDQAKMNLAVSNDDIDFI